MDLDAFLEVFNTLYAVDLVGDAEEKSSTKTTQKEKSGSTGKATEVVALREGYCEGSWEGEGCGGR